MRKLIGSVVLAASGIFGVLGAAGRKVEPAAPVAAPAANDKFIVHEWGTFTNFSGSDGLQFEFRPLVDQELPAFIYDRARLLENPFLMLTKSDVKARQRMETPVTYFYTDRPRQVDVRVDFPQGLLTEFYPPAGELTPPYTADEPALRNSSLSWQVKLHLPVTFAQMGRKQKEGETAPSLPPVSGDDHYGFARQTDSAVVEVTDHFNQPHYEKFLFYRGVGNFSLPLRLEALPERHFRVVNDGPEAIESLFLVMIGPDGLRFCQQPRVLPQATAEMVVPESPATADELSDRMAEALVGADLYEKEAMAMVHTWQSSWFSEPGARLFYIVPRRLTDEIIPLSVQPVPDEVVRVLVGRMEVLTPEAADRLTAVTSGLGTCVSIDAEPLRSELDRLGRFAEPALAHLAAYGTDPTTQDAIRRAITMLRR